MFKSDALRIQSTRSGGDMSSCGFASLAQAAGDRNANASSGSSGQPGENTRSSTIGNAGSTSGTQGSGSSAGKR
ncbi:hypothetical protein N7510_011147 [Penicillium lagena]|uniref:uncharacterized protein n=1 Tax=Penicillium lagena TaxID=94218 RepID=UPI00253FE7F6|nr:uncharacterized protein N7510_011147 [Penicillium lagena]KAJ5601613.1 hypothetical protein N7510_011147 [Penicillium lagena]